MSSRCRILAIMGAGVTVLASAAAATAGLVAVPVYEIRTMTMQNLRPDRADR